MSAGNGKRRPAKAAYEIPAKSSRRKSTPRDRHAPGAYARGAGAYVGTGLGQAIPVRFVANDDGSTTAKPAEHGLIGGKSLLRGDFDPDRRADLLRRHGSKALGLHTAEHVRGLDIDDPAAFAAWLGGRELSPSGYVYSTSRGADSARRMLWFRIPPELPLIDKLRNGAGDWIDVIHRFALVWPSVHRETGAPYRWYFTGGTWDSAGRALDDDAPVPHATELPWLEVSR